MVRNVFDKGIKSFWFYPFFIYSLFVLLVGFSLFFIKRCSTTDWGEDFASYLMQAKGISTCNLAEENKFVYDACNYRKMPTAFPWGFPIFLSAFVPIFKMNMSSYILLMHFILAVLLLVLFKFLSEKENKFIAFLIVLLFSFNPEVIYFKNEIMSEFFFMLLLFLFFIYYEKVHKSRAAFWFLAIPLAFIINIRTAGIALLPAIFFYEWFSHGGDRKKNLIRAGMMFLVVLCLSAVISVLTSSKSGKSFVVEYWQVLQNDWSVSGLLFNLKAYFFLTADYFIPRHEIKQWAVSSIQAFTLLSIAAGIYSVARNKRFDLYFYFSMFYIALVVGMFQVQYAPARYFFLVVPFLLLMIFEGWRFLLHKLKLRSPVFLALAACGALLLYYPNIKYIINNPAEPDGPQVTEAMGAWNAIKRLTTENDTVYFLQPKVLALFTRRYGHAYCNEMNERATYILNDSKYLPPANSDPSMFHSVWSNARFELYERINYTHKKF